MKILSVIIIKHMRAEYINLIVNYYLHLCSQGNDNL